MADIVERLLVAARDETQSNAPLLQEAADELVRLRNDYRKIMGKVENYEKLAEPEF
jgi:hypothetical protein